jgi:hypothetical protein
VQRRLDEHPEKMRQRRETVEHPFGTASTSFRAAGCRTAPLEPESPARFAVGLLTNGAVIGRPTGGRKTLVPALIVSPGLVYAAGHRDLRHEQGRSS